MINAASCAKAETNPLDIIDKPIKAITALATTNFIRFILKSIYDEISMKAFT